jgi:hypothetical protein
MELPIESALSKNASGLDPLGHSPMERQRRIALMRARRFGEAPDSDLNILLFAYDELQRDFDEMETRMRLGQSTKTGA